jgi:hypothetical protein
MQFDLYYDSALVAIRVLTANLQNPNFILTPDERIDLIQFIADLQNELDNEAERSYLEQQQGGY